MIQSQRLLFETNRKIKRAYMIQKKMLYLAVVISGCSSCMDPFSGGTIVCKMPLAKTAESELPRKSQNARTVFSKAYNIKALKEKYGGDFNISRFLNEAGIHLRRKEQIFYGPSTNIVILRGVQETHDKLTLALSKAQK